MTDSADIKQERDTDESPPREEPRRDLAVLDQDVQVRALASAERIQILNLLIDRVGTAKQVSDWAGQTRGRAHYHIRELLKAGLVEVVRTSERRGILEKYYRAVARNFCLAQGIGELSELSAELKGFLSGRMLGWRRERILNVDQKAMVDRVVRDCLHLGPGDLLLIRAGIDQQELIGLFHDAAARAGGRVVVFYGPRDQGAFLTRWAGEIHSVLVLEEAPSTAAIREAPPERARHDPERLALLDAMLDRLEQNPDRIAPGYPMADDLSASLIRSGVRYLFLAYPSPERAGLLGLDFELLHDSFWTAVDVDYQAVAARCRQLQDLLRTGQDVRVISTGGAELRFELAGREAVSEDGDLSSEKTAKGEAYGYLPAGKITVAPKEGTAQGRLRAPLTSAAGLGIRDVVLEFRDGVVVFADAGRNGDVLRRLLERQSGAALHLGGFEIGVNPRITNPIGYPSWDARCHGDVNIGIGDNQYLGGTNRSSFRGGFRAHRPTLLVDGRPILRDRTFLLD